jgi:hypothetical protein
MVRSNAPENGHFTSEFDGLREDDKMGEARLKKT